MTEGIRFGGMEMLLERETELAMISSGLDGALAGEGSILVVEGEAGIGKSELLRVAAARAVDKGLWVMRARASELEHEYAYGVVRQLLVPVFAAMTRDAQVDVLAGAARLAGPVLGLGSADDPDRAAETVPDHGAVLHGLYWLTVNIAARQPLLISLDDAQWSDGRSLRFVAFLARRLEGLPIMVLLSIRAEDVAAALTPLSELATEPLACKRVVRPRPLRDAAVRGLIGESLAAPAEDEFVRAFTKATGGVPFLVRELLKALAEDGVKPTGAAASLLDQVSPQTVTRATMLRLARLGPTAIRAAQGIAVLGATATPLGLSNLTDVPEPPLEAALDALVSARILRAVPALEFVHPLVQTSVYEDIPPSVSSAMQRARRPCWQRCTPIPSRSPLTSCALGRTTIRATPSCSSTRPIALSGVVLPTPPRPTFVTRSKRIWTGICTGACCSSSGGASS